MSPRAAITAVFALNGFGLGAWASRIPAIKERLALSEGELAIALVAIAGGAIIAMPLAGGWAVRAGSRTVTRAGAVAFLLLTPLLALAPSLPALVLAAFAFGLGNGTVEVAMNAHGVAVERDRGRPLLSGMHAAFSLGALAGAATGALLAAADVDERAHFAAVSVLGALILAAAWRGLAGPQSRDEGGRAFALPSGVLWLLGALAFCCLMAEGAALDWSAVYVREDLAQSAGLAGAAYAAFSITMAAGRLVGDRLVAVVGPVRLVRSGALLAGGALGAALLAESPAAAFAGLALMGAGLSCVVPVVFRAAGNAPGHAPAVGIAAVSTVGYFGFLAGPPLVGALAEAVSLPVGLGAIAALLGGVALSARAVAPAS